MDELPVAGYFRVSQAREDMKAPDLYRDDIDHYCSYRNLTVARSSPTSTTRATAAPRSVPPSRNSSSAATSSPPSSSPSCRASGAASKTDRDGIALHFLDMNLDTSTSQGRLLRHIMAAFAEYESDVKSDYAKATQRMLAREGRAVGAPPYGYRWSGIGSERTFAIDEETAAIVRELFAGSLAGRSVTAMARDLNTRGVVGQRGGEWSRQRVKTILDNPVYAGFRRHEGDEFPGKRPALVSREIFDRVRRVRHERRTTYNDPPGYRNHLLSGVLACELCGHNLHYGRLSDRVGACPSVPPT